VGDRVKSVQVCVNDSSVWDKNERQHEVSVSKGSCGTMTDPSLLVFSQNCERFLFIVTDKSRDKGTGRKKVSVLSKTTVKLQETESSCHGVKTMIWSGGRMCSIRGPGFWIGS